MKKNAVTFPVLEDQGNKYAVKLNLDFVLPEKLQEIYKALTIDLERFNGDNSWVLPMAARFIVDTKGVIRNAEVNLDHTMRPEPEEIIELLAALN